MGAPLDDSVLTVRLEIYLQMLNILLHETNEASKMSSVEFTQKKFKLKNNKSKTQLMLTSLTPIALSACGSATIVSNIIEGNGQINIGNTNNGTSNTNIGSDNVGGISDDTSLDNNQTSTSDNPSSSGIIYGTTGDDINITGTSGDDIIDPLTGKDKIFVFSGQDAVYLGSGSKYIDFGVDNSPDLLIVDLNEVDTQSTIVNFSYSNEDQIQFDGTLYDGYDKSTLVTNEDRDDFTDNVKFQEHIASLAQNGIFSYIFNTALGDFGNQTAINFREEGDLKILQYIEAALEDTSSGDDGLGILSGSQGQVQNAVDGSKVMLSLADSFGNVAWVVYEETGSDADFSDELSLILVTSMTTDKSYFGDVTLPGPGDIG